MIENIYYLQQQFQILGEIYMRQVYIHIGLHKTATTFLQKKIFPKLDNINYLSRPYTNLNHAFNKLQYADDTRFCRQEFTQEINQLQSDKDLLISEEMLSGTPYFNYVNRSTIAYRLQDVFPEAKIILFLRGQKDMLLSLHNTWVKALGGTKSLESFTVCPSENYTYSQYRVGRPFDKTTFYLHHDYFSLNLSNFLYYELVKLYKELFPDVYIFLFEEFRENPRKIIEELETIFGKRFAELDAGKISNPVNVSLSKSSLEKQRFRNALRDLTDSQTLLKVGGVLFQLHYQLFRSRSDRHNLDRLIGEFYRENNQKLSRLCPDLNFDRYLDKYQF